MTIPSMLCRTFTCALRGRWVLLLMVAAIGGCSGTAAVPAEDSAGGKIQLSASRISPDELERMNRGFADRTVMRLSTATDQMLQENSDAVQCRHIRDMRATASMSIYDIVTDRDAYLQTLNLTVVITLQKITWIDEDNAHKVFGDRAGPLVNLVRAAYADVRELAAHLFSPAQLETLDSLVVEWRQKNPDVRHLFNAQFTDFINASELSEQSRQAAGGLFNEIEQTRQTVEDTRALAERALYISKRMPLLIAWRSEATADSLVADHQLGQFLSDFHSVAGTVERLPAILDRQRESLVADFDKRQQAIDGSVKNVHEMLAQADSLVTSVKTLLPELQKTLIALGEVVNRTDAVAARFLVPQSATQPGAGSALASEGMPGGSWSRIVATTAPSTGTSRLFDIQDYASALREASSAARDLNGALISSQQLLDSPAWHARITEINSAADGRVHLAADESKRLVGIVFTNVYIALGGLLVVLVVARVLAAWLTSKKRFAEP